MSSRRAIEELADVDQKLDAINRGVEALATACSSFHDGVEEGGHHPQAQRRRLLDSRRCWQCKRDEAVARVRDCLAQDFVRARTREDPRDVWAAVAWVLEQGCFPTLPGSVRLAEEVRGAFEPDDVIDALERLAADPAWRSLITCPPSTDSIQGPNVYRRSGTPSHTSTGARLPRGVRSCGARPQSARFYSEQRRAQLQCGQQAPARASATAEQRSNAVRIYAESEEEALERQLRRLRRDLQFQVKRPEPTRMHAEETREAVVRLRAAQFKRALGIDHVSMQHLPQHLESRQLLSPRAHSARLRCTGACSPGAALASARQCPWRSCR